MYIYRSLYATVQQFSPEKWTTKHHNASLQPRGTIDESKNVNNRRSILAERRAKKGEGGAFAGELRPSLQRV